MKKRNLTKPLVKHLYSTLLFLFCIGVLSLNEYNSIMETVHLLSSKSNADKLYESIIQMKEGKTVNGDLIQD